MILITGATGNIGFELARLLGERGIAARAMHRRPDDAQKFDRLGLETARASFDDIDSLQAAMRGCDQVFLLPPPTAQQEQSEKAALTAAQRAGVKRILKISASHANLTSAVPWAKAHAIGENSLRQTGLDWTILRPSAFFQNFLQLKDPVQKGFLPVAAGRGRVAYVDARDVAAVACGILEQDAHHRATYFLTGPDALTMREIAEQLSDALERKVRYIDLPKPAYWAALRLAGVEPRLARGLVAQFAGVVAGGHDIAVTEDVERLTGRPARTFAAFSREQKKAFTRN